MTRGRWVYRPRHRRRQRTANGAVRYLFGVMLLPFQLVMLVAAFSWDDITNIFGSATDIAQRIRDVVQDALAAVINWVSRAFDWSTNWLNNIQAWIGWATEWFTRRIDSVWDTLTGLNSWVANGLLQWVSQLVDSARSLAYSVLDAARGEFNGLFRTAMGAVDNLMQWTIDNVFYPLAGWIGPVADQLSQLAGWIPARIAEVVQWVEQRIWDVVSWVTSPITAAVNFITDDILPLWRKVKGWLEFLADHPFDWWLRLLDVLRDKASQSLVGFILDSIQKNSAQVEEWLAKWLAS